MVEAGATELRPSSQQLKKTSFSHNSYDYKGATADALSHSCLYNKCKGRREREGEGRGGRDHIQIFTLYPHSIPINTKV